MPSAQRKRDRNHLVVSDLSHYSETTYGNSYTERFVRKIKESCLNQMIFFGENMLRNTIREFVNHYHRERNHQGLDNRLLEPVEIIGTTTGLGRKRERVGGLLNYYYREAA